MLRKTEMRCVIELKLRFPSSKRVLTLKTTQTMINLRLEIRTTTDPLGVLLLVRCVG